MATLNTSGSPDAPRMRACGKASVSPTATRRPNRWSLKNDGLVDVVVLDVSGRLTLGDDSTRLKDKINSVIQQGSRQILLNLGDVSYIDSGGLGQLVSSFTGVRRAQGDLKLFNLGKRSKDLLAMTKLLMVFETYDSEAEAVASFETPA